jgi:hypothetical protein
VLVTVLVVVLVVVLVTVLVVAVLVAVLAAALVAVLVAVLVHWVLQQVLCQHTQQNIRAMTQNAWHSHLCHDLPGGRAFWHECVLAPYHAPLILPGVGVSIAKWPTILC